MSGEQGVMSGVQGEWGVRCESEEEAEQQRRTEFCRTVLSASRSQLRILQQSYQVYHGCYRPRSTGDNTFGSIRVSVCLSVGALLFEPFDLDFWHEGGP